MTYPRVTIEGTDLPEPIDGIDDREYADADHAVYYPQHFKIKPDLEMVYLQYDEDTRRWIDLDSIRSITAKHPDRSSQN
jgi:hypothetical protein